MIRRRERTALWLVAGAAAALIGMGIWAVRGGQPETPSSPPPTWESLAPPSSTAFATWRWLVFSGGGGPAHFAVGAAPGDMARISILPAWQLQSGVPGYPADAIVVAVNGRGDNELIEGRLVDLGAVLIRHIPTLRLRQAGADRRQPPPGLDAERLRFRIRERMDAALR